MYLCKDEPLRVFKNPLGSKIVFKLLQRCKEKVGFLPTLLPVRKAASLTIVPLPANGISLTMTSGNSRR